MRVAFNVLASLSILACAVALLRMAWFAYDESAALGATAQTPWATPLIIPQSVWYAGLVTFALVATGYAVRATWLLATTRTEALNHDFQPRGAKEELKEELDDLAARQDTEAVAPRMTTAAQGVTP